jgi:predicted aldo/keto reductase-like oxidoreductase
MNAHPQQRRSRREFLRASALSGAGLLVLARPLRGAEPGAEPLPTRILGRTKARVTILGLGTAPVGEGPVGVQEGARIFGEVMDRGVTYVDTARSYGTAEEALSLVLPRRRDKLFLVTKCWTDSGAQAQKLFETSLRTLKVDHLDLVHIHNMGNKDPQKVLAKDGILEYLLKQKEAGKLRFIGLSGHERPPRFLEVLKTGQIDVVMGVMNYADRNIYGFEEKVLPECRKQGVGVVAMKVYVGIKGGFPNHRKGSVGCVTRPELMPQAIAYALDLEGVSVANIGPYTFEQGIQNVEMARAYKPLGEEERTKLLALGKQIAAEIGPRYGPVA